MFNIVIFEQLLHQQVRQKEITAKTMDGYLRCITQLEIRCNNKDGPSAVIIEEALNKLSQGNNQLAKYIAAIKKYEIDVLNSPKLLLYGEPLMRLRAKKRKLISSGKKLSNSESTYTHKINAIRDTKLKLALRLQKQSGLRVSEVSDLTKHDIIFDEPSRSITLKVRNGKGGKARTVNVMRDDYLYDGLIVFIEPLDEQEKIFYSSDYLIKKAGEYNIKTHDLRRINSRQRFRGELDEGATRREARTEVANELGHSLPKITNVYLGDEWKEEKHADGEE
ncbi:MAG: tyrosine-type recombinase/integrase [Aminipila sp.]